MALPKSRRIRAYLLACVAVSALLLVAAWSFWSGPSIDRAGRAYDRGDWATAVSESGKVLERDPGDERAIRLRARGLARLDRRPEASALDARLGGDRLEAEDLYLLGQSLLRDHRPTLGWAALDAASKLEPRHPGTLEALADRSRAGADPGGKADRLSAIPGGPALAELVVGLSALGEGPAPSDPNRLLDSVVRRERSTLLQIRSAADARRLMARLLLEEARAGEAREWIGQDDDPESRWLLGRAYLVEGDVKRAATSLEQAGSFGEDRPMAPEPSRYRGAKECARCHREIYEAQQSSHHSATLAWGDGLKSVPLPDKEVTDPGNPAVVHRFGRDGGGLELTSDLGGETVRAVIDYALGSGHHGVTMLAREDDGRHRSLRLSYYSGGKHWGLTSGFPPIPADKHDYIGEVLNEESFRNCLNCHTTRFTSERDRQGPEVADRGIGCERCHGPGDHHVRAVEAGLSQPAIARPRVATPGQRLKLCAQCHASDGVIPPADPRFIRFQATTLLYSRCSTESGGRLDCVGCHDPHRDIQTDPGYYEARCLTCHGEGRKTNSGVRIEPMKATRCPVNAAGGCISCHMPKAKDIMPFMEFTDHHIRANRPAGDAGRLRSSR